MTQFRLVVFVGLVLGVGVAVWATTERGPGVPLGGPVAVTATGPAAEERQPVPSASAANDERIAVTTDAVPSAVSLAGYVRHEPAKSDLDRYRKLRLRAKNVGVELPRSIFGTAQMWAEIADVEGAYWMDIATLRGQRSRALHRVALRLRKEQSGVRVGNLGEFQRGNRASGGSDREVLVSGGDGTYSITVEPGMDAEVDRLDTDYRVLSVVCAETLAHVLRTHGAM